MTMHSRIAKNIYRPLRRIATLARILNLKKMHKTKHDHNRLCDIKENDLFFVRQFDGFTMTSLERRLHLLDAVRYIVANNIAGAIVECGVWRGGSMMLVAEALKSLGQSDREIFLFDTFCGMTNPTEKDIDFSGRFAADALASEEESKLSSRTWAIASLNDVKENLSATRYPEDQLHYVVGDVLSTVPSHAPDHIAILRLDTDWYESTHHELEYLVPRVVQGGIVIIDDYGHWGGAREAVDEFVRSAGRPIFLSRIDYTCRSFIVQEIDKTSFGDV